MKSDVVTLRDLVRRLVPRSLLARLIYFISVAQLCIAGMWMVYSWGQVWDYAMGEERARLEAIASTIASDLDGSLHEAESGGFDEQGEIGRWAGAPSSLVHMQRRLVEAVHGADPSTRVFSLELRADRRREVMESPRTVHLGALEEVLSSAAEPAWRRRHDYHPSMAEPLLEARTTSATDLESEGSWVAAFAPITAGSRVTGLLQVQVPREVVTARARAAIREEFLLIGAMVGLALGGVAVICFRVTRDLSELGRAARRFGAGEYRERIATESGIEEVRALAASMETARAQIESDMKLREELHHQMERARGEAELAAKTKAQFLANMSHEIRTPLNGIIGMTGLLESSDLDSEQLEMMVTVRKSGEHLLELIDDILDFSKLEAGKLELEEVEFELQQLLEATCEIMAPRAHEKGLELVLDVHHAVPAVVRGDSARMRQVLLNFIGNAVKFTEDGEVVVEVRTRGPESGLQHVHVSVRDSGIGIPADRRDALFRPFSQVDASTTRKYGGTGLGLAISAQLVRVMRGDIGVDSQPGRGSTFWFQVPLGLVGEPRAESSGENDELAGVRVLLVEDNRAQRDVLRAQLEDWGSEVCGVGTAEAALDRLVDPEHAFDLAVIDSSLPGMSGERLAECVRRTEAGRRVPLVLLRTIGHHCSSAELESIGLAGCLTKPVRRRQLSDCLGTVLGVERLRRRGEAPEERLVTEQSLLDTQVRERKRILLVEDNPVNQRVAVALLRRAGYRCLMASNGAEALETIASEPVDLVLMDCQMPVVDGFEATQRIREGEEETGNHLPIVAMTANALTGDRERCLQAGMDDYLAKPIDSAELYATLERWLVAAEKRASASASSWADVASELTGLVEQVSAALERDDTAEAEECARRLAATAERVGDETTRTLAVEIAGAELVEGAVRGEWIERLAEHTREL